ncbi:MAG: peptidylprolyl isomerase [Crocinitomicaceae bacterium]
MKRMIVLAFAMTFGMAFGQEDPVIMTVDGKPVHKSEFLQIYLKNNDAPRYDKEALDEYMDLFVKFKLKVAEAEALGYDTIPKLMRELNGYRKQLALPYLIDSTKNEELIKEAYERMKTEVRASHILIRVESNASPDDTLAAYNRLMSLKKRIEKGEDFASVARGKMGSEDPSAANNGGDLGYFTAFQMVYPFEEKAYTTKVGEVSEPFRTRFGYHILKVTDKRDARGTIEAAHLMISVKEDESQDVVSIAKSKIDEIYGLLKKGESFEELVKKHSDDPSTSDKGGVLPSFGTGTTTRMVPEFENAAFALKNDGDISEPIRTQYGYHIIKRLSWKPLDSFEDLERQIAGKVAKDERSKQTQNSFVQKLKAEYGYTNNKKEALVWFYENVDSTYHYGKFDPNNLKTDNVLFTLGKEVYTQKNFADFLAKNFRGARMDHPRVVVDKQYERWEKKAILDSEEGKLASKYPAFKALINEYHDGILLYEVMSDKVWNKAMKDTSGLQEYHAAHRNEYMWEKRYNLELIEAYDKVVAKTAYKLMKKGKMDITKVAQELNGDSQLKVKYKQGKFEASKLTYLHDDLKVKLNKPYQVDDKFYVVRIKEVLEAGPKEFKEAKGAITSDYQDHLEKEWLKELRTKHKVEIDHDALYSLGK